MLDKEFGDSSDHDWPLSVVFVDLDYFKKINDTHGHRIGDLILKASAEILCASTRESDVVARFGGDEFVILLPGTDQDRAGVVCKRIVESFGGSQHEIDGQPISITASVGVATQDSSCRFDDVAHLLESADQALYLAKKRGRNQAASYAEASEQKSA